jgi:TatD DNase family protein
MHLIDTHAHIYLPEFKEDLPAILQSAASEGIRSILMPAIDASTHRSMLELEAEYTHCKSMIGLHPCSVKTGFAEELEIVNDFLGERPFVAIGEIGLDFYWDKTFVDQQYTAFHQQLQWALEYDLPFVIHSREAVEECIEVVRQYPGARGVFHCFSGSEAQARAILELDCMLGIGGVLTFKNAGLDKVMASVGLDGVILETDAPYLAPVPYRGKRNQPAYLKEIVQKLAAVTGKEVKQVAEITTANANKLFKLKDKP